MTRVNRVTHHNQREGDQFAQSQIRPHGKFFWRLKEFLCFSVVKEVIFLKNITINVILLFE